MPIRVKRVSDGSVHKLDVTPETRVGEVKSRIRAEFAPQFPNGCRLIVNGKVLKSIHRLKRYGVTDGGEIIMDDSKNWSSSSSSSDSD
ncbi:unnamed protein product [Brachionus calyciflorus]|uniref:Ubiquitin-like domain-containing protein n=1 Tax=Brachionus calyciflorus TaxID=104777 RepID=A0A814KM53_9BILA|nr:unnamed protein product [Brachionus calyciflorus]